MAVHRREDELRITNVDDATRYLNSHRVLSGNDLERIRRTVDRDITEHGFFRVGKEMGVFECTQPISARAIG